MGVTSKPKIGDFVHLHNHTHYSVLDGLQKIPTMLDRIVELGMSSVALTDHGTLSGAIEFYQECKKRNIRPIIGMEAYVANRGHLDKDPAKDRSRYHLIILAMNNTGYQNLMRLSSIANLDGFYFKPRIDHELLERYNEGLIVLSGCIGGEVGEYFRYDQPDKALEVAEWYKSIFGDRYYIEVQDHSHSWEEQKRVNDQLITLAKKLSIDVVVTSDAHYSRHEDQEAHEILLCVQTGSFFEDKDRFSLKDTDLFITDPKDIIDRWGEHHPEFISNTAKLAARCEVSLELGGILIPKFETPKEHTEKSYLELLTYQGLAWRYGNVTYKKSLKLTKKDAIKVLPENIKERAKYELGVIDSMGFNGYFLIIWDFIKWGKDSGIVFGPGRGSAAGSIISYALRITDIEPLTYDLLFERFLNPDRISMPDIDIDIQDTRRDEVIQYVTEKYGTDRVANIVTFGKMFARNAVRDVARVLQVPYTEADRLAKMIPPPVQGRHIPLSISIVDNNDLRAEYESNEVSRRVFDLAIHLEGTIRSHGVHAAGVVIAPEEIVKYAPLEMAQKGVIATQYAMNPIEDIGLLKMDFLGLSNLTVIKNALRIVKKVYGKDITIEDIPLDDKKTYQILQKGETTGVFQLESAGMKRYLKELKPNVFEDIVAMVALYRPGPMQWIDDFISRKNGKTPIDYMHKSMESALKSTYGVIVYQEQVMQISKELSGFTGGQADTLRKAIGKKQVETMAKMKQDFIDGAIKHSKADREMMETLWAQLEDFAAYCFNKSHAACYALIAYQTAYLKAHYPAAFMAALMTNDFDDIDRLSIDITECRRMGIEVLPPNVNESFHEFAVILDENTKNASIRFGLDAIKNVGKGAVEEILSSRDNQRFTDLFDFAKRVNVRTVNRKNWESLIKSGAMDEFSDRGSLLASLDQIIQIAQKRQKEVLSAQVDLFGASVDEATVDAMSFSIKTTAVPIPSRDQLKWERELLGLYLSDHPLKGYEAYLSEHCVPISDISQDDDLKSATIGGIVNDIRVIQTKNGQQMAFVKIEDSAGEIEAIVFPGVYKDYSEMVQRDQIVLIKGRVNATDKNGALTVEPKILVEEVSLVEDEARSYVPVGSKVTFGAKKRPYVVKNQKQAISEEDSNPRQEVKLYVRIDDSSKGELLLALKSQLEDSRGTTEVVLVMGSQREKQAIRLPHRVTVDEETVRLISQIVGSGNVLVR